jgi:hypothetical protein
MGDFAVRVFASVESLSKLGRMSRARRPDCVLVDCATLSFSRIHELLAAQLPGVPAVLVDAPAAVGTATFTAQRPVDGLRLSALVDAAMRSGNGGRAIVRFRDIQLDIAKHQCVVAPSDEAVSLPLKESQLLKLFLERPGVCLSRDEIRVAIWDQVKVTPRTIDSHISRLRAKLAGAEVAIESVYGGGYVLR